MVTSFLGQSVLSSVVWCPQNVGGSFVSSCTTQDQWSCIVKDAARWLWPVWQQNKEALQDWSHKGEKKNLWEHGVSQVYYYIHHPPKKLTLAVGRGTYCKSTTLYLWSQVLKTQKQMVPWFYCLSYVKLYNSCSAFIPWTKNVGAPIFNCQPKTTLIGRHHNVLHHSWSGISPMHQSPCPLPSRHLQKFPADLPTISARYLKRFLLV